jgi:hypothetical protein
MAERCQLPRSCVPPTTRWKDCGHPPSGGLEGGKTRCMREREDMVAFQGGHPPFKGDSPYLRPQPSRAERAMHATVQRLQTSLHFRPDQRAKGRAAMQAACNRAKWAHLSDFQRARHGGPGPRVMRPVRRMLRASNCTATRATATPPRLRNQYRDSRQPYARPNSASLARWSIRPKMGR